MVDHTSFWVAHTGLPPENRVLTSSSFIDAAVFRTGGTTAVPKTSFVTRQELREGAQNMVNCLTRAGLRPGDHVANLLYGGDLYKGFLDLSLALIEATVPTLHLPIGVAPLDAQAWTIRSFSATVLVSMPTVVCRLADYLIEHKELPSTVRLILYIGELLHNDQKKLLRQAFPSARIGPLQYASVDGGFIGAPDSLPTNDDDDATIYAVNTQSMILELVTDDGELITEEGVRGNVLITNLARRLMPTIRYPMGDLAEWTDYRTRKFRLCGRGMVAVRIAHYSFDLSTLKAVVSSVMTSDTFTGFQVIVKREEATDVMIFRVASQPKDPDRLAREMQEALARIKTDWAEELEIGKFKPLSVEWVSFQDLTINRRTGKLREIVDLRVE
jgi:phenylacetate-CoA ligase